LTADTGPVFLIEKIAFGGVVIGGTENGEKGAVER
jgi:hypothetical protein